MQVMRKLRSVIGPGVITGAADDDPSGIATYSQAGAQFGYGLLWMALFMLPLQAAIQEACARIGAVTGKGIAAVIKENYGKSVLYVVVLLLCIANIINIGADIGAMAAAAQLIVPLNFYVLIFSFTLISLILEVFVAYRRYASLLKWLCLSLLAYPVSVFIVNANWYVLLKSTFVPHLEFNFEMLFIVIAVLGTTISPYLFFWQASEEVEEEHSRHLISRTGKPHIDWLFISKLRADNFLGMLISEIVAWSIIAVTATVLFSHGITDIKTAADAAKALEPLVQTFPHAGYISKVIFATGVIGLGLVSVPILAGSSAYALSEVLGWRHGLNLKLKRAHGFYGIIAVATLLGLSMNFIGIDPMRFLVYTAVINGVIAVPLILVIILISRNKRIMGEYKNKILSNSLLWITFIVMTLASIAMFYALYIR